MYLVKRRVGLLVFAQVPVSDAYKILHADVPWIDVAHAEGFAVYPYTVDTQAELRRCLEAGVDGLFTNNPDRLREMLDASLPQSQRSFD